MNISAICVLCEEIAKTRVLIKTSLGERSEEYALVVLMYDRRVVATWRVDNGRRLYGIAIRTPCMINGRPPVRTERWEEVTDEPTRARDCRVSRLRSPTHRERQRRQERKEGKWDAG